jgi:hypothetical protein
MQRADDRGQLFDTIIYKSIISRSNGVNNFKITTNHRII